MGFERAVWRVLNFALGLARARHARALPGGFFRIEQETQRVAFRSPRRPTAGTNAPHR